MLLFHTAELRTTENDVERPYDGGRVVCVAQSRALQKGEDIQLVTFVINYTEDEPMREWPVVRTELEDRRFDLFVLEGLTEGQREQIRAIATAAAAPGA